MPTSSTRVNNPRAVIARRLLAAGALTASFALPAHAGLFDDQEARRRIDELKQELSQQSKDNTARIDRLEETVRGINVVELLQQIEQLNAEIAKLRGQLEVLGNENQQIQKRQRDFYLDLDSRLKRLEGGAAGATPGAAPGAATPSASGGAGGTPAPGASAGGSPPGGDAAASGGSPSSPPAKPPSREDQARELRAYDVASNLFRRNDFPAAIEAFRGFLRQYPSSALAPNAEYWIGISYANMKDYPRALAAQEQLIAKYPQSSKAPDALLAIAAIQADEGDSGSARNTLEDIIARFPSSEAAGKARTRLAALRR